MTSEEIKRIVLAHVPREQLGDQLPFWEIAYQLAVMNERNDVPKLKNNPFGESLGLTVPPDSETEMRWTCTAYADLLADFTEWRKSTSGVCEEPSVDCRVALQFMFQKADTYFQRTSTPEPRRQASPDPQDLTVAQPDSEGA